ncbi:AAA family ATPase [Actinosynnema sp. NPDC059335]|uniref:AAA family ATPase n=1 Tax=Actinosynnema sp. NPDC059335 TaxID=3346804 RepID=UPI003670A9D1
MADRVENTISGGLFFAAVVQGRDITVTLPPRITPALSGLPPASTAFVGRDQEVAALTEVLEPGRTARVAAVTGMAGVGKTELAAQVTHLAVSRGWFPGGVFFVDLGGQRSGPAGHDAAHRVTGAFLRAAGVPDRHVPAEGHERVRLYRSVLAAYAADGRRVLLVIDDAGEGEVARSLLPSDDDTAVLVTARNTVADLDAVLVRLGPLDRWRAVDLLHRGLTALDPDDTRIATDPAAAAVVADLCDGLPLALRIVVALLAENPARTPAALAAELADPATRLHDLACGDLSVSAALDRSCADLDPVQLRLYRVLPGTPEVTAAEAAARLGLPEPTARRALAALARACLIEPVADDGDRWRVPELVRLHAGAPP